MSGFARACALSEIPVAGALACKIDGEPVAVVRTEEDEVYAIRDVCSHADVALSEGEVEDSTVECWLHGSRFDLRTGRPTGLPATQPVPVYAVQVDGDDVLVDIEARPFDPTNDSAAATAGKEF